MNDLERMRAQRPSSLLATRQQRDHNQVTQAVIFDAKEAALKTDAAAALTSLGMERSVDLYKYGQALAGDDPMLAGLMNRFVGTFAENALRRQRAFESGFEL